MTKQKKCKECGNKFTPRYSTVEAVCYQYECRTSFALKVVEKLRIAKAKKEREQKKEAKEKLKTLSQYEAEAKKSFQKYIRLRDKDLPCISCGNYNPTDWCGSHYFPAGMYSGLIFDERNCHGACNTYCNKYLSGNLHEYRKGLINRYGESFVIELENEADSKRDYKYTKEELIAKKLQYEIKIKELK